MPPLALSNGGILQHMHHQTALAHQQHISQQSQNTLQMCAAMMRPTFPFVSQTSMISQPSIAQALSGNVPSRVMSQNIGRGSTDVTSSNILPMLSPSK